MSAYLSSSEGEEDNDDMLQAKLADLEREVKDLHSEKHKLEQLLLQPVEFKSVACEEHVASATTNSKQQLQIFESQSLQKKLMLHKLSGAVVSKMEGREVVIEFNASVRGHYYGPYYARFNKVVGGLWEVKCYFLPDSVNLRKMAKTSPLRRDKDFILFVQSIQLSVEAYHDRKHQIMLAKEVAKSKHLKFFSSIDYMFVTFTVQKIDGRDLPVTISLIYESDGVRPSSLEAQSKGVDKKTLASIGKEFEVLKEVSLDEGFSNVFWKRDRESDSLSEGSGISYALEELKVQNQRSGSIESLDTVHLEGERDDPIKGQRKGVHLSSKRGTNRLREAVGSRSQGVASKSTRIGRVSRSKNTSFGFGMDKSRGLEGDSRTAKGSMEHKKKR